MPCEALSESALTLPMSTQSVASVPSA
jgi:hypothetical protein